MTLHNMAVSSAASAPDEGGSKEAQSQLTISDLSFEFDAFPDERGVLTVAQTADDAHLPFEVARIFWISQVPPNERRGMHAHRTCWEALVATSGSFKVKVDDGIHPPVVYHLDGPQRGVLIPPMVWCELYDFTPSTVCLCLASGKYDKDGYLSDHAHFVAEVQASPSF